MNAEKMYLQHVFATQAVRHAAETARHNTIVLNKLNDVANINAFVAFRPQRAKLVYKTSKSTGLWQLDLMDLENGKNWTIGHYVDGLEDRSVEYDVVVKRRWRGYADLLYADDDCLQYVVRWQSGYIFVMLPNEQKEQVAVVAPQVCGRHSTPLQEPVYIWRDVSGYYVLDCVNNLYVFETLSELENWIRTKRTIEDVEDKKLKVIWREWYVIPGRLNGREEWWAVVKKAKMFDYKPNPDEAVEIIRRLT
jgi:hypothetical protein